MKHGDLIDENWLSACCLARGYWHGGREGTLCQVCTKCDQANQFLHRETIKLCEEREREAFEAAQRGYWTFEDYKREQDGSD